jgi:hypothetical protein
VPEGVRDPVNHRTPAQKRADQKKRRQLPEEKAKATKRKAARRAMERAGKVSKGDGKDVAHKRALDHGGSNSLSNLAVQSPAKNRSHKMGSPKRK